MLPIVMLSTIAITLQANRKISITPTYRSRTSRVDWIRVSTVARSLMNYSITTTTITAWISGPIKVAYSNRTRPQATARKFQWAPGLQWSAGAWAPMIGRQKTRMTRMTKTRRKKSNPIKCPWQTRRFFRLTKTFWTRVAPSLKNSKT